MTVIEGNKLIAEFMGWEKSPYPNTPNKMYRDDNVNVLSIHVADLQYHTSWDWLMPVVEKIESLHAEIHGDKIKYFEFSISNKYYWLAVVDFIQWYNSNKK